MKEQGAGVNKRHWVIEMNECRQLYLNTYDEVDTFDWYIGRCHIQYISWKYWHSNKQHSDAATIVTAYDFYRELATEEQALSYFGCSEEELKDKILSFRDFKAQLSRQMLLYDPRKRAYPGDQSMRACTQQQKEGEGR